MKRPLTPDEENLWKQVATTAIPLSPKKKVEIGQREKHRPAATDPLKKHIHIPAFSHTPKLGSYANIDGNTVERFRKGHYPIDAALDLHGLSHDKAQAALERFLESHYRRGSRCLLVITGKGMVLRESLPHWLAASRLQPVILAFDAAQPRHGGSGAYYILLRRKRHERA